MKKIFIIIFSLCLNFNFATANTDIAYIDMDKVISMSKAGVSVFKQLNVINDKNLKEFKTTESNLKTKETKIISQKKLISNEEFQSSISKLRLEVEKYNEDRKKIINNFNRLKIVNTNNLLKMINPILIEYSNEKSISIILQKKDLIMGKKELDITDEVIKIVNSEIKEFKIK